MKSTVEFTPSAIEEYREALRFHLSESPQRAQLYLDTMEATVERIQDFPDAPPLVKARGVFQRQKIREILAGPYRVFYCRKGQVCYVLAVIHEVRNWKAVWRSRDRSIGP
jgi:plasmid stabilization system protein ParE